jgi:hypothetical protein
VARTEEVLAARSAHTFTSAQFARHLAQIHAKQKTILDFGLRLR